MNILLIANDAEIYKELHKKVKYEGHVLGDKKDRPVSLVDWFDTLYSMRGVSQENKIIEAVGALLGNGLTENSAPEVLIDLGERTELLPLNAFYTVNWIFLLVGKDIANWRILSPEGTSRSLLKHLEKSHETHKPEDNAAFLPWLELGRIFGTKIETILPEVRNARRMMEYRQGVSSARHSDSLSGFKTAFYELTGKLIRIDRTENDVYVARLFSGFGFVKSSAIVQVWLDSKVPGMLAEADPGIYRQVELEIFGMQANLAYEYIVKGIGGNDTVGLVKAFDQYNGNAKIYLGYQGFVISIENAR